jgi:integrase/recombinase XerD
MTTRAVQVSTIPSIAVFVRHSAACPRKGDEFYKNCRCPKHLRYSHNGKQRRQSAKTRSWSIAEQARRKIEAQFEAADPSKPISAVTVEGKAGTTIERAVELFVSDKRSQGVNAEVLKKYERELDRLKGARAAKGFPSLLPCVEPYYPRSDTLAYPSHNTADTATH